MNLDITADFFNADDTNNSHGDEDISVNLDNDLVDNDLLDSEINLEIDPIETIAGDIDVNMDLATDILGEAADPLIDEGNGGTGDNTLLEAVGDNLANIVDNIYNNDGLDTALNLLNPDLDQDSPLPALDNDWTQVNDTITDGLFSDIIGAGESENAFLPDPSGTVAEGIGAICIDTDSNLGSLGGLFG